MILEALTNIPQNKRVLAEKLRTTTREVELAIQAARLEGHAILSNSGGYYLSTDPEEIRRCAERLRNRSLTQMKTASALWKSADKMPAKLWPDL
jgi:biotin operon repressor